MSITSGVHRALDEVTPAVPLGPTGAARQPPDSPLPALIRRQISAGLRPMPPVPADEYASVEVRRALRRDRSERSARYRSRWWFPLLILGVVVTGFWGALKVDQRVADKLVWPSHGARFAEVSSSIDTPQRPGGRLTVVVGGLNRTSGTGVALALLPALEADGSRVFSLVYGSGINDQDIRDKFDQLVADVRPREVSFFGSSMGGDVVLNMAAHAQQNRDQYVQDELLDGPAPPDPAPVAGLPAPDGAPDRSLASGPTITDPALDLPLGGESRALTDFLVPAALADAAPGLVGQLPVAAVAAADPNVGPNMEPNPGPNADPHAGSAAGNPPGADGTGDPASPGRQSAETSAGTGTAADAAAAGGSTKGGEQPLTALPPPRIGTIFLDCTPLGADDVRDASRTQADALTGLTEAIGTDGGAATRVAAELLVQRHQWATGRFPFLQVRWDDLDYKFDQVMREKIGGPGVSTQLIKDQYGVIRRLDLGAIADTLAPGTRIVYFSPATPTDDRTVRVERVQTELRALATTMGLEVEFVPIPDGHHASAESNADSYRLAIDSADDIGG